MAGSTRRLPSWMVAPPPPPPASSSENGEDRADTRTSKGRRGKIALERQPETSTSERRRRKVSPTNNGDNARKKAKAKRDESPVSEKTSAPIVPLQEEDHAQLLTVEDLVSLAEEYVRAANEEESEQNRSRGNNKFGGAVSVNKHNSPPQVANSMPNLTMEPIPISMGTTGDPAQDMLHLFLGPLLTKPAAGGKEG